MEKAIYFSYTPQNVSDDFMAVAEHLVENLGIPVPERYAAKSILHRRYHSSVGPSTSAWRVSSTPSSASASFIRNHGV